MYAIKGVKEVQNVSPNLLPCQIKHNGPVPVDKRYWTPEAGKNDSQTVYFRGRKLESRQVRLPEGYAGVVLQKTDEVEQPRSSSIEEDAVEAPVDTKILAKHAHFNEFVVWDHEAVPQPDDTYVKGVEEWIKFAEAMHLPSSSSDVS